MTIQLLSAAEIDLVEGYRFYEKQLPGLGEYFEDCLLSDIESLLLYAGIHRQVWGFHRLISKRFPYAIYYRYSDEIIKVYAVLDCRRDPKANLHRLRGESS